MQTIEFRLSKKLKKRCARHAVVDRTGGKIGVGISIGLAVGSVLAIPLILIFDPDGITIDMGPWADISILSGTMFVCSIMAFACTYRQQNAYIAVRINERLILQDNQLRYLFRIDNSQQPFSYHEIIICLDETSVQRQGRKLVFTGGVYGERYLDIRTDQPKDLSEMSAIERPFEISDYWEPSLIQVVANEMQNSQMYV